ncbi:metal ABC transporter substrate-binding protein [Sporosarcina luteola]|uniref:metal ABC transporter substrate-binding protein n=1 Tax=Sporosarcina luteola TaxID=582850 RepID=UPI00203F7AD2|nr:metal ABC transporter substrate-binding protein [Sporosarcina luteola]MCM3744299.1 metal ABC transporter substrate-binding protein [Sporosarcina luteola]
MKNLLVLAVITLLLLVGCSQQETLPKAEDNDSSEIEKDALELVIPSRESILKDGYPVNENGQTYGPNMGNDTITLGEPDLLLAEGENGVIGYIYQIKSISSPNELAAISSQKSTPLYLQDGKTIIGTFNFH